MGQEDVPSSKVSVYKGLPSQVAHASGNILAKFDEENGQSFWELSLAVTVDEMSWVGVMSWVLWYDVMGMNKCTVGMA